MRRFVIKGSAPPLAKVAQRWASSVGGPRRLSNKQLDPIRTPVIRQGGPTVPRLRNPGSSKVVVFTNKKGRTFSVRIPLATITHPQRKRAAPIGNAINGSWKSVNTAFSDTGDTDVDMPTMVDEALQMGKDMAFIGRELANLCREYTLMDTEGMIRGATISERHFGPDYELDDRKLKRRRHWFAICNRFEDVRSLLFPLEHHPQDGVSVEVRYDVLRWLHAANQFGITTRLPFESHLDQRFFEPLDLTSAVESLATQVSPVWHLFFNDDNNERLIVCHSLCQSYSVPFRQFVPQSSTGHVFDVLHQTQLAAGEPLSQQTALRFLQMFVGPRAVPFSLCDEQGVILHEVVQTTERLLSTLTRVATTDALASLTASEVDVVLQFLVAIHRDNASRLDAMPEFRKQLQFHVEVVVGRCRTLLYSKEYNQGVQQMDEDGDVPLIAMQKHSERAHSPPALQKVTVHHKLGMQHAEGMRVGSIDAASAAAMTEALQELQRLENDWMRALSTDQLVEDILGHVLHRVRRARGKLTFVDAVRTLRSLGDTRMGSAARAELLAVVDTTIASQVQTVRDGALIVQMFDALAVAQFRPKSWVVLMSTTLRVLTEKNLPLPLLNVLLNALTKLAAPQETSSVLLRHIALCGLRAAMTAKRSELPSMEDIVSFCSSLRDASADRSRRHQSILLRLVLCHRHQLALTPLGRIKWCILLSELSSVLCSKQGVDLREYLNRTLTALSSTTVLCPLPLFAELAQLCKKLNREIPSSIGCTQEHTPSLALLAGLLQSTAALPIDHPSRPLLVHSLVMDHAQVLLEQCKSRSVTSWSEIFDCATIILSLQHNKQIDTVEGVERAAELAAHFLHWTSSDARHSLSLRVHHHHTNASFELTNAKRQLQRLDDEQKISLIHSLLAADSAAMEVARKTHDDLQ